MIKQAIILSIATLALSSMSPSARACQPYFFVPYVLDLDDGEHVFVMGTGEEARRAYRQRPRRYEIEAYDYPRSGLYVKGDRENPVWTWDGPNIEYGNLERSISADGQVLFFVNDRVSKDSTFLAVYRAGVKISEYGMEHFVDRVQHLVSFPCEWGRRWARSWILDEADGRLKVETFAGRVIEIEAESGAITASESIVIKDLEGRLKIRNGTSLSVSRIGICERPEPAGERLPPEMDRLRYLMSPVAGEFVRDDDGLTDVPAFTISEVDETPLEGGAILQNWSHATIRLDRVRRMEFAPVKDSADVLANIELIDGSRLAWRIGGGAWGICARGADGEAHRLPVRRIEWLAVFGSGSGA